MRLEALFPRQSDNCLQCPTTPACNCAANQQCFLINRDCNTCATVRCVSVEATNSSSSVGVSKGAVAGAIIAALIFLALAVCLFLWYRRRLRLRKFPGHEVNADIPASAETVLKRPDPTEKPSTPSPIEPNIVRVYSSSNMTIDLDPQSQNSPLHSPSRHSVQSNPFSDNHSIQTAGTESTNSHGSLSDTMPTTSTSPVRPVRSPDLNLDHVNVSRDSIRPPNALYAPSQRSENSYLANDHNPVKGNVRVVKAEVINAGTLSPVSAEGSRLSTIASRPSVGSPLASRSFGPGDVVKEEDEAANPFRDESSSPSASVTTFGHASGTHNSVRSDWADGPTLPWTRSEDRPSSMSTQAGSVIDIGSATRVNVSLNGLGGGYATSPLTGGSFPRSPFRTTMGRLVTPNLGSLEEQQQRALDHAQARAHAQGGDHPNRRISDSSVMSAAADSILESFPFVPPSPISDRPMRSSPPVSPLGQQTFSSSVSTPRRTEFPKTQKGDDSDSDLPAPPNRRTLGMSTASQFSTASSEPSNPPTAFNGRQRASLDTLALTSDLSSYPLGFDRDSVAVPHLPHNNL
ncbi:hypothetical protein B0H10DRAFT_2048701, partial [Mycena sp. CBHHK59/15]